MNDTIIAKTEAYIWIINGLSASYMRYAKNNHIDLSDTKSEFGKIYYDILELKRNVRFYNTEEELENCEKFIDRAKKILEGLGGSYIG